LPTKLCNRAALLSWPGGPRARWMKLRAARTRGPSEQRLRVRGAGRSRPRAVRRRWWDALFDKAAGSPGFRRRRVSLGLVRTAEDGVDRLKLYDDGSVTCSGSPRIKRRRPSSSTRTRHEVQAGAAATATGSPGHSCLLVVSSFVVFRH
jgi:hypothetical protein